MRDKRSQACGVVYKQYIKLLLPWTIIVRKETKEGLNLILMPQMKVLYFTLQILGVRIDAKTRLIHTLTRK